MKKTADQQAVLAENVHPFYFCVQQPCDENIRPGHPLARPLGWGAGPARPAAVRDNHHNLVLYPEAAGCLVIVVAFVRPCAAK